MFVFVTLLYLLNNYRCDIVSYCYLAMVGDLKYQKQINILLLLLNIMYLPINIVIFN